ARRPCPLVLVEGVERLVRCAGREMELGAKRADVHRHHPVVELGCGTLRLSGDRRAALELAHAPQGGSLVEASVREDERHPESRRLADLAIGGLDGLGVVRRKYRGTCEGVEKRRQDEWITRSRGQRKDLLGGFEC